MHFVELLAWNLEMEFLVIWVTKSILQKWNVKNEIWKRRFKQRETRKCLYYAVFNVENEQESILDKFCLVYES